MSRASSRRALRRLVERAPLDKLIRGGFSLSDLLG